MQGSTVYRFVAYASAPSYQAPLRTTTTRCVTRSPPPADHAAAMEASRRRDLEIAPYWKRGGTHTRGAPNLDRQRRRRVCLGRPCLTGVRTPPAGWRPRCCAGRGGRAGATVTTCALDEARDPTCLAAGTDAAPPPCQRNGGRSETVSSQGRRGLAAAGGCVRGDRWATDGLESAPAGTEFRKETRARGSATQVTSRVSLRNGR